jgi:hypothetical protein
MRDPEFKDKPKAYTAMERTLIRTALNQARYDNKKGSAKKAVAKKAVAKKAAAPKPTDSRFSGVKKPSVTKPKDSRFSGLGAGKPKPSGTGGYTPGSAKSGKAAYTTGSGVRYTSATKKATPAQKTKSLKKNPLVKFVTSRVGGKSGGYGNSK